eukprot:3045560-Prymnesium_polylepis.1
MRPCVCHAPFDMASWVDELIFYRFAKAERLLTPLGRHRCLALASLSLSAAATDDAVGDDAHEAVLGPGGGAGQVSRPGAHDLGADPPA